MLAAGPYGIVRDYTGHGIGSEMHQPPAVPNHGRPGRGPKLVLGLALAVEPMVAAGDQDSVVLDDDWTVATADGSLGRALRAHLHPHRARRLGADRPRRRPGAARGPRRALRRRLTRRFPGVLGRA